MKPFPSFRSLSSSTLCAALVACASTAEPPAPTVLRTPPPQGYEKTITNYLAFKIRDPQRNSKINVGQPEQGDCSLDVHLNSMRGWVVPVVYETRTGEVTGKETIKITAKPFYFWFLGNTIAGVTPRTEQCPGIGTAFEEPSPPKTETPPEPAKADSAQAKAPPSTSQGKKKKTGTPSGGSKK